MKDSDFSALQARWDAVEPSFDHDDGIESVEQLLRDVPIFTRPAELVASTVATLDKHDNGPIEEAYELAYDALCKLDKLMNRY